MENLLFRAYQQLGDYFTGKTKRRFFYLIVLLMLGAIFYFSVIGKLIVPEDTLYWIFSAIVQSVVALGAFVGVLVIFKYQSISSYEEFVLNKLQEGNSPLASLGGALNATNIPELLQNMEKIIGKEKKGVDEGWHGNRLRKIQETLKTNDALRTYLHDFAVKFSVYISFVVLLCLLSLVFTPFMSIYYLGYPSLFLIIFFTSYALFLVVKGMAETLAV